MCGRKFVTLYEKWQYSSICLHDLEVHKILRLWCNNSKNLNFKTVTIIPYFLNSITPVNQFAKTTKEKYFVDKLELIEKMNELVDTASQYICITRPHRFGKTINAMILTIIPKMLNSKHSLINLKLVKVNHI